VFTGRPTVLWIGARIYLGEEMMMSSLALGAPPARGPVLRAPTLKTRPQEARRDVSVRMCPSPASTSAEFSDEDIQEVVKSKVRTILALLAQRPPPAKRGCSGADGVSMSTHCVGSAVK